MMKFPVYKLKINETDTETGVEFVALVDSPAIEKNFVAFDSYKELFQIKNQEQRIVSGALMVANLPIYRRDEQYGEYYVVFDKETISQIVHKFFRNKNNANVNLMHDPNQKVSDVYMYESFIIDRARGINPPTGFEKLSDGSWFGSFKVNNDAVWEQVKSGQFKGFSIEGIFQHEFIADSEPIFIDRLREILLKSLNNNEENVIYKKPTDMELKLNEKIKEKIEAIKALVFSEDVKMTDAKLADGTIISYEGDTPVAGAKVFIVDATGKNPAPDGDYEMTDGTVLTVQGGVIMDVKAGVAPVEDEVQNAEVPAATETETKLADYPWDECIKDQLARYGDQTIAEKVCAAIKNGTVGMRELVDANAKIVDLEIALAKVTKSIEEREAKVEAEFKSVKELNKSLFEVIEKMANIPDAEPIVKPATPFKTGSNKQDKIVELTKHLQTIKNK